MVALARLKRPEVSGECARFFPMPSSSITKEKPGVTRKTLTEQERPQFARELDRSLISRIADDPVGCGTFGTCFLAMYRGIKVAVKEMNKQSGSRSDAQRCKLEVLCEARVLHILGDHPCLPLVLGICTKQQPFCLVLKFHGIGEESLTLHKAAKHKLMNKAETNTVFQEICKALEYIHSKGYLHNDLKAYNVVLERQGDSFHPIIIDFGKSRAIEKAEGRKRCVNSEYIAPEVKNGNKESAASDVYSFGKMLEAVVSCRSFKDAFANIILTTPADYACARPTVDTVLTELMKA